REHVAVRLAPGRGARRRLLAREPRLRAEPDAPGAIDDGAVQADVVLHEPVPTLVVVQRNVAAAAERIVARLGRPEHGAQAGRAAAEEGASGQERSGVIHRHVSLLSVGTREFYPAAWRLGACHRHIPLFAHLSTSWLLTEPECSIVR